MKTDLILEFRDDTSSAERRPKMGETIMAAALRWAGGQGANRPSLRGGPIWNGGGRFITRWGRMIRGPRAVDMGQGRVTRG